MRLRALPPPSALKGTFAHTLPQNKKRISDNTLTLSNDLRSAYMSAVAAMFLLAYMGGLRPFLTPADPPESVPPPPSPAMQPGSQKPANDQNT